MAVEPDIRDRVAALLGRQPRGLEEVAVWSEAGNPSVIRVASLVDDKPFPTLYWLIDAGLCYAIDQVEAGGLILQLQQIVDDTPSLRQSMRQDHEAHIHRRAGYMSKATAAQIDRLGYSEVFQTKGIGGIGDFTRIRCLHTWYAAHLVEPNTIGRLLEAHWADAA